MTCRGYDPKTVKIAKSVKRLAATILDNHLRGSYIKDYVRVMQSQSRSAKRGNDDGSKE